MNENHAIANVVTLRVDKAQIFRWLLLGLLLLFSAFSLMINPGAFSPEKYADWEFSKLFTQLRNIMRGVSIAHFLAICVLTLTYNRILLRKEKPFCLTAFLVGGVLSAFMLLGTSLYAFKDFSFIVGTNCQLIIALILWIGWWIMLYSGLKYFYTKLDNMTLKTYRYEGILAKIDSHFQTFSFVAILVCWLIFMLPYFPGSIPHDGRNQLNMVYGYFEWHTHHPYYSTLIMGAVYGLGEKLFGIIGGCLFYVLFQSILGAVVFSQISEYIRFKTQRLWPGLLCLLYFAIAPMWWTYMQAIIKDTLFAIAFAFFTLEYVKIFLKDAKRKDLIGLGVSAFLVCCLRNGCQYIVIPALLALILAVTDRRKLLCIVFSAVLLMDFLANTVVIDSLGLTPVNQVEALSIPLQQIACYVTRHEDEITEEEKDIINAVVQYEGIPDRYNPELSDPIKNKYRNTSEEEWSAFWRLWAEKLLDDPWAYITAMMNHVSGYIDPFYFTKVMSGYQLYNKDAINDSDKGVVYSEYLLPAEWRDIVWAWVRMWDIIPGLSFVVNPGSYTWIGIILIAGLLRKRQWRSVLMFVAPLMVLLICFASPVNGLLRYMLPVMAAIPPLILVGLFPYLDKHTVVPVPEETQ